MRKIFLVSGSVLYMGLKVGDPEKDHQCWMRPENMKTPRSVLQIDQSNPGTEIAAETSAAMAASSIVFRHFDRPYAHQLLNKAKLVIYHSFQYFHSDLFHWLGFCPVSIGLTQIRHNSIVNKYFPIIVFKMLQLP